MKTLPARRAFLLALAALAARPVAAHTPYRQWKVLRERFLLVHSTRSDPHGDALADKIVAILHEVLPAANAMAARSPDEPRLAGLLTTGQAVLAVMRPSDAHDLYLGRAAFAAHDGRALRRLLTVDARLLVTVASFPRHHAWLVSAALTQQPGALAIKVPRAEESGVPVHPGALAYAGGEPLEAQK